MNEGGRRDVSPCRVGHNSRRTETRTQASERRLLILDYDLLLSPVLESVEELAAPHPQKLQARRPRPLFSRRPPTDV